LDKIAENTSKTTKVKVKNESCLLGYIPKLYFSMTGEGLPLTRMRKKKKLKGMLDPPQMKINNVPKTSL
jgi:hypothetical protein